MGASKQKKDRVALRNSGNDAKAIAAAEKAQKDKKYKVKSIVAAVIVVIVIAAAIVINSNVFYTKTTAVKVGNTSYSAAEVNAFFRTAFNGVYEDFYSTYGDYMSLFFDPNKPLDEQQYSDEQTWADYVWELAQKSMVQITALYDAAKANGYQLPAEEVANIDAQLAALDTYAVQYGYDNANGFLAANYGKGMDVKLYRSFLERVQLANSYATTTTASYEYTQAEKEAYYAENADLLDYITYYYYSVSSSNSFFEDLEDDAKAAAAHDAAVQIADARDLEDLNANIQDFTGDASEAMTLRNQSPNIGSAYRDWLVDSARKTGDVTVVDYDGGTYVVMYVSRDKNDYKLVDMRHILINAEADDEGNVSTEALEAAKAKAEEVYAQWQTNPTEDNFAALANEYSTDTGSSENGGLYEQIFKGAMVPEIDAFLFDEGSKAGDTTLVYGSNGSYEGYHVVYFVGEGELFCDYMADSLLRNDAFNAYCNELEAGYTITTGAGMKFADLK